MEGINCTHYQKYNHTSLKTHLVCAFVRKLWMSVFLFMCGLAFANTVSAQCEGNFSVVPTRTYNPVTDKTTYIFAVTRNAGARFALSHWSLTFDYCPGQPTTFLNGATIAYSTNGVTYTSLGTPNVAVDPSQDCFTTPVLKFDWGQGAVGTTNYYRLVVNGYWIGNFGDMVFKYGRLCCTQPFPGPRVCMEEPWDPLESTCRHASLSIL